MASSGWQNEQWIINCSGSNYYYNGSIRIDSIVHGSGKVTVTGTVALCSRGSSGWRYNWQQPIYVNINGGGDVLVRATGYVYVGTDTYINQGTTSVTGTFSTDIAVADSATSCNISVRYYAIGGSGIEKTLTWALSFDPYVPPVTFTPKLYGSVNGRARKIGKLYCSVSNQTRKIKKLYAGDGNGNAKLIYEDNS